MDNDRFYVKTLTLENFRCFEKTELGPFDPRFNLIIGANGVGKSSVLLALANLFREMGTPELDGPSNKLVDQTDVRLEHRRGKDGVTSLDMRLPSQLSATAMFRSDPVVALEIVADPRNPGRDANIEVVRAGGNPSLKWPAGKNERGELIDEPLPLIINYPAIGRFAALKSERGSPEEKFVRFSAFADWHDAGIALGDLREWFKLQTLAALQSHPEVAHLFGGTAPTSKLALAINSCNWVWFTEPW